MLLLRSRRSRRLRRWRGWMLGLEQRALARGGAVLRWLAALLVVGAVTACEKQPAKIRIKLPREAVQSVKMDPVLPPFEKKGDTVKLRASAFDKDDVYMGNAQVNWRVEDASVASVNYEGVVTILSSGATKVIAEGTGYEKPLSAELPIKAVIVEKVKIVPPEGGDKLHMGETKQYKAEVLDDRGNVVPDAKITWRTSDYAATVSVTGEVEGRAIGDTQIIAEVGVLNDRYTVQVLDWAKGAK